MEKRYLSVVEVARYMGFSQSAIRKWVRTNQIPFCKVNGGVRFDIKKIDQWLERKNSMN